MQVEFKHTTKEEDAALVAQYAALRSEYGYKPVMEGDESAGFLLAVKDAGTDHEKVVGGVRFSEVKGHVKKDRAPGEEEEPAVKMGWVPADRVALLQLENMFPKAKDGGVDIRKDFTALYVDGMFMDPAAVAEDATLIPRILDEIGLSVRKKPDVDLDAYYRKQVKPETVPPDERSKTGGHWRNYDLAYFMPEGKLAHYIERFYKKQGLDVKNYGPINYSGHNGIAKSKPLLAIILNPELTRYMPDPGEPYTAVC